MLVLYARRNSFFILEESLQIYFLSVTPGRGWYNFGRVFFGTSNQVVYSMNFDY